MKNMLVLASAFTVFMAVLLVWMDHALADHLEKHLLPETEIKPQRIEKDMPEIMLPEITIRPCKRKTAARQLPEVAAATRHCNGV